MEVSFVCLSYFSCSSTNSGPPSPAQVNFGQTCHSAGNNLQHNCNNLYYCWIFIAKSLKAYQLVINYFVIPKCFMCLCPVLSLPWQNTLPNLPLKLVIKHLQEQLCHPIYLYAPHSSMWWLSVTSLMLAALARADSLAHSLVCAGLAHVFFPMPLGLDRAS